MGFWSSVGSAISSACSSIGSAIGSACSAVMGGIGSVISNAGSLFSALAIVIPITGALGKVVAALDIIGKILGVQEPGEDTEDIGDRAIQAQEAGISPEDYATYKEYSAAIKNFELDPKRSAEISDLDKKLAGIATQAWAYEDKFDKLVDKSKPVDEQVLGFLQFLKAEKFNQSIELFEKDETTNQWNKLELTPNGKDKNPTTC